MFLDVHHLVCGVECRMLRERREVKEADMVCGHDVGVGLPLLQVVKESAEVDEGAVIPIILWSDRELDIDDLRVIEQELNVQDKTLAADIVSQFDRVQDCDGLYLVRL